jgi:hypothetical protein
MRSVLALSLAVLLMPACAAAASAEKRTFIIANTPDASGANRCLANGQACGAAAAAAYCKSRQFSAAGAFRKIERDEITGAVPTSAACGRNGCDEFVAIECRR